MDVLTRSTEVILRKSGKKSRLQPYLDWTVVEDRTLFDGASTDAVRKHFLNWVATRSDERDGPGAAQEHVPNKSPRYCACLYVDKDAVEAASMESVDNGYGFELYRYTGRVILIDARPPRPVREDDSDEEDEDNKFPPLGGNTDYDVPACSCWRIDVLGQTFPVR